MRSKADKPVEVRPTAARPPGFNSGMQAVAEVTRASMADTAKDQHGTLAEVSHIAALAASRLRDAAAGISNADLEAITGMLHDIQNKAHVAFLRKHGSEADYQAAGRKVAQHYKARPRSRKATSG